MQTRNCIPRPMRLAEPKEPVPMQRTCPITSVSTGWPTLVTGWLNGERTQNTKYRDKIITGMKSIAALKNGLFTGNMVLGYDLATGVISYEGDPNRQNTNHLMTIMGGFEIMNEMQEMIQVPEFNKVWLEHARDYKQKSLEITSYNRFRVCRLMAYSVPSVWPENSRRGLERFMEQPGTYSGTGIQDRKSASEVLRNYGWMDNQHQWCCIVESDAIYMQEVINRTPLYYR